MLLNGTGVPILWIDVRCKINSLWYPLDKATLNWNFHGITIHDLQQIRKGENTASEVIEEDYWLSDIAVEPALSCVLVDVGQVMELVNLFRFAGPRFAPVDDILRFPRTGFELISDVGVKESGVLSVNAKVLIAYIVS